MKKTLYITTLSLALLLLNACSDFLDEALEGTYSQATFFQKEEHALLAINGTYEIVSFKSSSNALWVFGDVASDDAVKGGNPGDQIDIQFIDDFTYNNNNGYLDRIWRHYYEGISRANYVIEYVPEIEMNNELRARIVGEAKFLRAYFYFNLVNIFGEVPLKLSPPVNESAINVAKSSVEAIYSQIEADLKEATAVLGITYTGSGVGRATKGSALGLLAKAQLYQQKWAATLQTIAEIEALGVYELMPLFSDNFRDSTQNNQEALFEIQHINNQSPRLGNSLNQWFAPLQESGYFFNAPLQDFVDAFESNADGVVDPRLDYTVGREGSEWLNGEPFNPAWSVTGYLFKKHQQPLREIPRGLKGDGSLNYIYLRYADILLMKAEALNESNDPAAALLPLNQVRERARESYLQDENLEGFGQVPEGLLPAITSTNQNTLRQLIRNERRVELGGEFHRYFDLMRYGSQAAEAALSSTGFSYAVHRYFAIPLSEIDTNAQINN